jgi:carboxyl-terminal processing protease
MRKLTVSVLIVVGAFSSVTAQQSQPARSDSSSAAAKSASEGKPELRQKTFEVVWRTVKEKHFDPTFGGVDWEQVRAQYEPRVATVKSDREFYDLLNAMLGELHLSHFQVVPPEYLKEGESKRLGGIGVDVRLIDERAVLTSVEAGSTGERAGLRPGFVINKIDETTIAELVERFMKRQQAPAVKRASLTQDIIRRIMGEPLTAVRLAYLDEQDQPHEATITREKRKGEVYLLEGVIPRYAEFESKRLAGGIAYIRFNRFSSHIDAKVRATLESLNDAPGLIIDLRGNPGGEDSLGLTIVERLLSKQTVFMTSRTRNGIKNYVAHPKRNSYSGPVVLLIDELSGSASEQMAAGLQELGRVRVIGTRSHGSDLDADVKVLPNGALLSYAYGEPRTPKGVVIEGRGVIPDIEVNLTRALLLKGGDPQLEAAVRYLQEAREQKAAR